VAPIDALRHHAFLAPQIFISRWVAQRISSVSPDPASRLGHTISILQESRAAKDLDKRPMQRCSTVPGTVSLMFRWLFQRIERIIDWAARREVRKRDEIERDRY
jgi:hypothetical protein